MSKRSALPAVLLVVACGGATATPENGIESACARLYAAYARNELRCKGPYADVAPEPDFVASCVGLASARGSRLVPADLDACTGSIGGCPSGPPACLGSGSDLLFPAHDKRGSLPDGATCLAGLQCASGFCNTTYTTPCGVCVVPKAVGAACDYARDVCEGQSLCDGTRCTYGSGGEGATCITYGGGTCARPFYCGAKDPGDGPSVEGRCRPRGAPGAACATNEPCVEGIACVAGICRVPLPEGAPCDAGRDLCATDRLGACVGGICVFPRTGVQEGGACGPDVCRLDLTCRDHVCAAIPTAPRPGPGAPCTVSGLCAAGASCEGFRARGNDDPGTCRPQGGVGAPCPCSDALTCINGKCAAWSDALCR